MMSKRADRRFWHGQSLIELAVGLIVMIPVLLVLFDLSMIFLGVQANDTICRNAARAAASSDPLEATPRALCVIEQANSRSSAPMASKFVLIEPVEVQVLSRPVPQYDAALEHDVTPPGPVIGTTTVTTEVAIKPFMAPIVYGGKSELRFRSTQTFPITYIQPSS